MREATTHYDTGARFCEGCPLAGSCEGDIVASRDRLMKVSFFTLSVPEGDPDFVATRTYQDAKGGESEETILSIDAIADCDQPRRSSVISRGLARMQGRRALEGCGAMVARWEAAEQRSKEADAASAEARKREVQLTADEYRALRELDADQLDALAKLSTDETNALILASRADPSGMAQFAPEQ